MRVLQINSVCGFGSTGNIVMDLANALMAQGDECFVAYGQLDTGYKNSFRIGTRTENHLHNLGSRILGRQGYHSHRGTGNLIRYIEKIKPDLIHLHNLHGHYLNLGMLFSFLSGAGIPVVWTLHDCWAFTGRCSSYSEAGCNRWQTRCYDCPQLSKYPPSLFLDRSEEMYEDKKKWFTSVKKMTLITVSEWLTGEVKKSFLSKYPVCAVYNWVDQTIFKPLAEDGRKVYGIDENKFIILGVSAGWISSSSKLKDFIRLAKMTGNDMQLVLAGGIKGRVPVPPNVKLISYLHNPVELARLYSMADVYVHFSLEDTFGKVIAEALSCGTPAIVYNSTACPEILGEGCGYVAERRDVEEVYSKIRQIQSEGKQKYSSACVNHVRDNFGMNKNIGRTLNIYKNMLAA
ncbi:MAG: glycosyltransferase [Ignavibacteriales bacterium]